MILAKTNMVSMPESCKKCKLWVKDTPNYGWCRIRGGGLLEVFKYRPSWCPLMEVEDKDE